MLTLARQYTLDECLRQQNLLTNEDLIVELTDHFTLSIHQQMTDGIPFEDALTNVVADFGGLAELQRMERRYNGVTFSRYTNLWKRAALDLFKGRSLWLTLALFGLVVYVDTASVPIQKWPSFFGGFSLGISAGIVLLCLQHSSQYMLALFRRGYHNPPAEVQYMLTRVLGGTLLLVGIGEQGVPFAENLPLLLHAFVVATYITSVYVYLVSYSRLYRQLHNTDSFIWNP